MRGFFSMDGWFWQLTSEIADMILLSLLWMLCCVPVVTIGPATIALYFVMIKKARGEADEGFWALFKRSFRRNFRQGVVVGLIFTALLVLLYIDIRFYANAQGTLKPVFGSLTVVGGVVFLLLSPYVFGLMAMFDNKITRFFFNAFYLSLRHLIRSICMIILLVAAIAVLLYYPALIIIVPGLAVYGNARLLSKSFDPFITAAKEAEGSEEAVEMKTDEIAEEADEPSD